MAQTVHIPVEDFDRSEKASRLIHQSKLLIRAGESLVGKRSK